MSEKITNPLLEGDLKAAAFLCLEAAARTDFDRFPPGSGGLLRHMYHEREKRFEQALVMMKNGMTNLLELGLSREDCAWAVGKAHRAKDKEGWFSRFQAAEDELMSVHMQQFIEGIQPVQV